jgi:type III secretion protein V
LARNIHFCGEIRDQRAGGMMRAGNGASAVKVNPVNKFLAQVAQRRDLALVALLFGIVFLMIIPMPTFLVDTLLAFNIAISVTLLILGVYLKDPLEISTLPSIILVSVIFRLALSITTTRLILATGDPGQIVKTFGDFVVFGNLVVGLVIFLIITVVQFMVITKGAERVAEVAARFSLDGLPPGKQMSIDSDLRAGLISVEDARNRRQTLEKEMQFYGAMDGSMKFVKGDSIAGLIITVINLVGGLAIGTAQLGMPMNEALDLYARLTVGDGLVAQIPALMLSITAGAIITRVTTEKSENLGADISLQLFGKPMVLRTAAGVLLIFAFIPGFPVLIFLSLAAIMIAGRILRKKLKQDGLKKGISTPLALPMRKPVSSTALRRFRLL